MAGSLLGSKEGRPDDIPADIRFRYYNTTKRIAADHAPKPKSLEELENFWYHGPSGTGKSLKARKENPAAYIKMNNKWWDGYAGEATVIIEDIDIYDVKLAGDIKRWSDHYPFPAEFKGGVMHIRPKKVIITSNYAPEEIWTDEQTLGPINRRYEVIRFGPERTGLASIFNK